MPSWRILPVLFLVMAFSFSCAWCLLLPGNMKDFAQSLVAVFASNILFWQKSGYFDAAAELKPLLHTWSLAVEEQYYVLFPLFIILAWRFGRRWIVVLTTVLSAGWGALSGLSRKVPAGEREGGHSRLGGFACGSAGKWNPAVADGPRSVHGEQLPAGSGAGRGMAGRLP